MIKKSMENHKIDFASKKEIESRNNYTDVLPYDYNRVVLSICDNDIHSHYINASYVDVSSIAQSNINQHFKKNL